MQTIYVLLLPFLFLSFFSANVLVHSIFVLVMSIQISFTQPRHAVLFDNIYFICISCLEI